MSNGELLSIRGVIGMSSFLDFTFSNLDVFEPNWLILRGIGLSLSGFVTSDIVLSMTDNLPIVSTSTSYNGSLPVFI